MSSDTWIGRCLAEIAPLKPEKTIIFSDGGAADKREALRIADTMPGNIDCFFCRPAKYLYDEHRMNAWSQFHNIPVEKLYKYLMSAADLPFMRELARRGGGRCIDYQPFITPVAAEIEASLPRLAKIVRVRRIHIHHDGGNEIIDHRQAQQESGFTPTTARVRRRRP